MVIRDRSIYIYWRVAKETRFRPKNILLRRKLRRRAGFGSSLSAGSGVFLAQLSGPSFVGLQRWNSRITTS